MIKTGPKIGKNILGFCESDEQFSNGINDFSEIMQKALDSGERILYLPEGDYKIGKPLFINSNTTLVLDKNARLFAADNSMKKRGDFLLSNSTKNRGNKNIKIYGGIWDGNNKANPKGEMYDRRGYSGSLLCFMNVKNLVLSGMKLHNPSAFFIRLCRIDAFLIENIEFSSDNLVSNNDGVHLGGFCENGIIKKLRAVTKGSTSDDMIAINADDSVTRVENLDMECGYIKNIYIDNIYAEDCHTFIRMLSIDSKISNICINNITGGFRNYLINMDAARYCRTPLISKSDPGYLEGVGCIENITFNNVKVGKTENNHRELNIFESNMNNFEISNFKLNENSCDKECSTFKLSKIGKSNINLFGITEKQLQMVEKNSKITNLSYTNRESGKLDVKIITDYFDYLILPFGDFEYLRIEGGVDE